MKKTPWRVVALLAAALNQWATAQAAGSEPAMTQAETHSVNATKMMPFAKLVNEVAPLRRRSVTAPNPLTLFDGVLVGLVHSSSGSLSLRRRDLVGVTLSPLILDRVYDSRRQAGPDGDFGAGGWRLSLASSITLRGDDAVYVSETGAQRRLRRVGQRLRPVRAAPGALADIVVSDSDRIELTRHDASLQVFERQPGMPLFLLAREVDRFGNERRHEYDRAGRLRRVTSGARVFEFLRNARGNVREVRDDAGRSVRYDYDGLGRLVAAIDMGGHPWHYHYDAQGRLQDITAPGGQHDLAVFYDASGRVSSVERQGAERRFEYDVAAGQPDGIRVTRVADAGRQRLFGHNQDGVTVWVQNAAGQRSRIWLNDDNQPRRLDVAGRESLTLRYDEQSRLSDLRQSHDEGVTGRTIRYASDGRPAAILGDAGNALAVITRGAGGVVDVTGPDLHRRLGVTRKGAAASLVLEADSTLLFTVNDNGQIASASHGSAAVVEFAYDEVAQLASVTFADGEQHAYRYDDLGLRSGTRVSDGGRVDYYYAPEGRIYRYEMTAADGRRAVTSHAFDAHNRLTEIRQENERIRLRYREDGALASIAPPGAELEFDYDTLARLSGVQLDGQRWRYRYGDGEPDLVSQAEQRRYPTAFDPRFGGGELAGVYAALYLRRQPASHGALWLDTGAGEFRLTHALGVPLPGDELRLALRAIGLLDGRFQPALFAPSRDAHSAFNAPSSFFFVPPEYWSLNCVVCPGHYPRPAGATRNAPVEWPTLDAVVSALEHVCYLFPYNVPVPTCRVVVSGLPPYLCMGDVVDAGASLTPASLQPDNLSWSTNDFLQVQPVGATGTTVTLRGVPGTTTVTSGVGTVNGVYSGDGLECTSTTQAVNVIAEKARNYTQLTDLNMCPERQQDTQVLHPVDGCSIPPLVSDVLFSGNIQDPVGGTHSAPDRETVFGADQGLVPHGAPIAPLPCNRHDMCYQTCGHNRRGCDDLFDDDMAAVCAAAYPTTCPFGFGTPACIAFEQEKATCQIVRAAVYQGVRVAGAASYRQRQVQHCKCCP